MSIWVLPVSLKTRVMVDQHLLSNRQTIIFTPKDGTKSNFSLESYFKENFQEFVKKLACFQKIKAPVHPFYLITVLKI